MDLMDWAKLGRLFEDSDSMGSSMRDSDDEDDWDFHLSKSEVKNMKTCQSLCRNMSKIRKEGSFCDVTISIGSRKFPVHKMVLSASSKYFHAMFSGLFMENNKDCVEIKGVSESVFSDLLEYMYGENLTLTFDNIKELYRAADMFCVEDLFNDCMMFFQNNWRASGSSNLYNVYKRVVELEFEDMAEKIIKYALQRLLGRLPKYYCNFPHELLCEVLESKLVNTDLVLNKGLRLVTSLVKWAFHKSDERVPGKALELFSLIPLQFFTTSAYSQILRTCRFVGISFDDNEMETFIKGLKDLYRKSLSVISDNNIEMVFLDLSHDGGVRTLSVFNSSILRWETKKCPVGVKPESVLFKEDELYIFGTEECFKVNTQTQAVVQLPSLPKERTAFTVNVVDNTLYVAGGEQKDANGDIREVLALKKNCDSWTWVTNWEESKSGALAVPYEHCLYFVGGENSSQERIRSSEVVMFDCRANNFLKICDQYLLCPLKQYKITIHDGVLYVFTVNYFDMVFCVDLKNKERVSKVLQLQSHGDILNVSSVKEGILVAIKCKKDNILLGIVKPSTMHKVEYLAYIPKPSNFRINTFRENHVYLRRKNPRVYDKNLNC